ncbi:MAG TPA: hypothetical protein VHA37_05255, partial [Candidatus Saccharimonadales bacterium]|nr:hypothetical protein [Candidatus Saccharimonadales bacterium]
LAEGKRRVLPMVKNLAEHCARHERIFELIAAGKAAQARRAISADVRYGEMLLSESMAPMPAAEKPATERRKRAAAGRTAAARRKERS